MAEVITPYETLEAFLVANPASNHSSYVLTPPPALFSIGVYVSDAILEPVPGGLSVSVADAVLEPVGGTGPQLAFGVPSLSFASTAVGANINLTVTISNPGTADLVISSLIPTGDFTVATIVED